MKRSDLTFTVVKVPLDFCMVIVAGIAIYFFRTRILDVFRPVLFEFNLPFQRYLLLLLGVALVFIGAYALSGLYSTSRRGLIEELSRVVISSSGAVLAVIFYIFIRQELFDSRFLILGGWFFVIIFVSLGRLILRYLHRYLVAHHDFGIQRVLVVGADEISARVVEKINLDPALGYRVIRALDNPNENALRHAYSEGIDEVILADLNYPADRVVQLVDFCHHHHVNFKFVPNLYQTLTANYAFDTSIGLPIVELRRTALDGWGRVFKRLLDFFGALLGLIILSPFFLILAVIIKLDSEGPVFVRLKRVSQQQEFEILKFRSMVKNAEALKKDLLVLNERSDSPLFKIKNDPRITPVGKIIRRLRIDELPQLVNVLKGQMSLVGPRPHQPDEIDRYAKHHRKVLNLKAGMTGMAQASGSSDLSFEEEVRLDTYYVENWSLWLDIKIIFRTLLKLLVDRSAV
ncbi:MAG: hypothetical protein COV31_02135 [Candidatus Yanofskybacteria bacterium CG10_big_fil_rev_8_21_14_0_10_46_23]|uniref:Bacterial sugar transferase domain-containing protein n=1 Tax=Candidatus Yanofskybacteria bacterium CG10_big_fil_rev_8_21_14_0_10_46_23 TaxID=1975098 RepID=A0A2H0R4E8_9BACT|nr:MAG: hypothetical protein COV31_02135 [Candidatus Yanofskybacteria bacterium CG10_big_fil_rev_8_21_14_0_10_46_23]